MSLFLTLSANGGRIGGIVLGAVCAVVLVFALYAGLMALYFRLRKHGGHRKYLNEISVIAIVLAFSVVMKFIAALYAVSFGKSLGNSVGEGFFATYFSLYSGIGGLTFEGIDASVADAANALVAILYAGSSLLAGSVILSVISAKASYEIYSRIRLRLARIFSRNKTDYYVFTTLTEDALTLAESIEEKYEVGQSGDKRRCGQGDSARKCRIIFAGTELEPFDKSEPLCLELNSKNYYYWSMLKEKNSARCLVEKLGIKKIAADTNVFVIACALDGNLKANETENAAFVFSDMKCVVSRGGLFGSGKKEAAAKRGKLIYYVVARYGADYSYYTNERMQILAPDYWTYKSEKKPIPKEYVEKLLFIDLRVVDEAQLSADNLCVRRINALGARLIEDVFPKRKAGESTADKKTADASVESAETAEPYRVAVLGFGEIGQSTLGALYQHTASATVTEKKTVDGKETCVEKTPEVVSFEADVFDYKLSETAGTYVYEHPMCAYGFDNCGSDVYARIGKIFCGNEYDKDGEGLKPYLSGLSPLKINFHDVSCTDVHFAEYMDNRLGDTASGVGNFRAVVVALGSDERNLDVANVLIDDITSEHNKDGGSYPSTVFVHIRDGRKTERLHGLQEKKSVTVVPFGMQNEIYSYDLFGFDDSKAIEYNSAYDLNYKTVNKAFGKDENKASDEAASEAPKKFSAGNVGGSEFFRMLFEEQNAKNIIGFFDKYLKSLSGEQTEKQLLDWSVLDLFRKRSNRAAEFYAPIALRWIEYAEKQGTDPYEKIYFLSVVEHERWARLHIASGWEFSANRNDSLKKHNCIVPFELLGNQTNADGTPLTYFKSGSVDADLYKKKAFDIINMLLAYGEKSKK